MLDRLFLAHPRTVQESYGEHLVVASSFGLTMIAAGMACMVHALVPGLFERTGSRAIQHLHDRMIQNRSRLVAQAPASNVAAAGEPQ
jgi:hypothetical protein|nr:DUF6356 family protein [uncultured Sphingomonas sp.]